MENEFEKEKNYLENTVRLAKDNLEESEKVFFRLEDTTIDEYALFVMQKKYETKIRNLYRAIENPYFARIDITQNKEDNKVYIGKMNIFDEDYNVAVADWRAPIASLYYDAQIGKCKYDSPEGEIETEMTLKRQYQIESGKLIDYQDIDVTANDELLQQVLNDVSDARMKNIISTIQKEQNEVIRAPMNKPLIIQGVAGSGKTTVALHRIAYLVYTYEERFRPEDFLIIAPNKFFLSYISNVLPDLGVDYVRQETFEDFVANLIKDKIKVEDSNQKLIEIVDKNENVENIKKICEFKSSLIFKDIIEDVIYDINLSLLPHEDFKIAGIKIIDYKELQNRFLDNMERLSAMERIEILKNYMQTKVFNMSESIMNEIQKRRTQKLEVLKNKVADDDFNKLRIKIFEETEYEIKSLIKGGKTLVSDYIKKIKKYSPLEIYKSIINTTGLLESKLPGEICDEIRKKFNSNIKKKYVEYEDLSALTLIQYRILGVGEKFSLKHIVIDEAQDLSEFQFFVLYEILKRNNSITILGDIAQGIYSYRGIKSWEKLNEVIFDNKSDIKYLKKSYRTTIEIMNEANKILNNVQNELKIKLAEPVARHGEDVKYEKFSSFEGKIEKINDFVQRMKNNNYKNIAIICKTNEECQKVYDKLKPRIEDINLIIENINKYDGGVTVVSSYFSKGLEFDSVIITDLENYDESLLDKKLLYIGYTRAMHVLEVLKNEIG